RGGTAEVVAYARELNRPLIIINAENLTVERENFTSLKIGDRHLTHMNRMPSVSDPTAAGSNDQAYGKVLGFHRKVDYAATRHGPNVRRLTIITLVLHVLATALATTTL